VRSVADALYSVAITLWVGGLWVVGYVAAPMLFSQLGAAAAGNIAGRLFAAMAWVGMSCAAYLLLFLIVRRGLGAFRSAVTWIVLAMLLLTVAARFGIHPIVEQIRAETARELMQGMVRDRFARWHGISSVLYLIQSALGAALVIVHGRGSR
jgi:hypothetical protein